VESEWSPVIVWFCLGLFALAEFGNVQMGGEIRRVCALASEPVASRSRAVDAEIGMICANRVPDDSYRRRLEVQHAQRP
jgi:hypothetical protein